MASNQQKMFEAFDKRCATKPRFYNASYYEAFGPFSVHNNPHPWAILRIELPMDNQRRDFFRAINPKLIDEEEFINFEQELANGIIRAHKIQNTIYSKGITAVIHYEPVSAEPFVYREDGKPTYIFLNTEHMYTSVFNELRAADLTISQLVSIAVQTAKIVKILDNRGYAHRNISPSCIYRDEDGNICLGDFLSAAHKDDTNYPLIILDDFFTAPEVKAGGHGGAGADMYSIAMILYTIFSHQDISHMPNTKKPYPKGVPACIKNAISIGLTSNSARIKDFISALEKLEVQCNRQWESPIISLFHSDGIEEDEQADDKDIDPLEKELGMVPFPQTQSNPDYEYKPANTKKVSQMGTILSASFGVIAGFLVIFVLLILLIMKGGFGVGQEQLTEPEADPANSSIVEPPNKSTTDPAYLTDTSDPEEQTETPATTTNSGDVLTYSQLEGVPEEDYDILNELYGLGILPANYLGNYDTELSRFDFSILAVNAYESAFGVMINTDETADFADVPGTDQQLYAKKAVAAGLMMLSEDGNFEPSVSVTREAVARALALIHSNRNSVTLLDSYACDPISDTDDISYWAMRYVQYSLGAGLLSLNDSGAFEPVSGVTKLDALLAIYEALTGTTVPSASSAAGNSTQATLDAPTGLSISVIGSEFEILWDSVDSAEGYIVQYSTDSNFSQTKKKVVDGTSVTVSKLKAGTYYVRVRAYAKNAVSDTTENDDEYRYGAWSTVGTIDVTEGTEE